MSANDAINRGALLLVINPGGKEDRRKLITAIDRWFTQAGTFNGSMPQHQKEALVFLKLEMMRFKIKLEQTPAAEEE